MRQKNRALVALMHQHGYVLVRQNRHAVWRHPQTKRQVVTALTASDRRAMDNLRQFLRRKVTS